MRDFTICIGTTFVFGRDAETKVGDELGAKGVSRVLIHHDGGAYLETSGLLDAVRRSLGRAGISYTELGGVKPNPRLTLVREGHRHRQSPQCRRRCGHRRRQRHRFGQGNRAGSRRRA